LKRTFVLLIGATGSGQVPPEAERRFVGQSWRSGLPNYMTAYGKSSRSHHAQVPPPTA